MKTTEEIKSEAIKLMDRCMNDKKISEELNTEFNKIFSQLQDKEHWKNATIPYNTSFELFAIYAYAALSWFAGGCEIQYNKDRCEYTISSKGYYHYIGA